VGDSDTVDDAVGEVLDALDRKGLTEDTLVVFAADNGCAPYIGVEDMNEQMKIAGVSGSAIELEITESLLIDDIEKTAKTMRQLKDCGITFALDDFGTGYASLGYLKELPLNRLKIDQSFVQDLTQDRNDTAIVQTILALGRSLEMEVIAEGIETEEQLVTLEKLGCSQFQGFYFSLPEPLDALTNAKETT